MINAGYLKYHLDFYSRNKIVSASGAIKYENVLAFSAKAQLLKFDENLKIDNKELFYFDVLKFKIRFNNNISNDMIIKYNNNDYKILSNNQNKFDNSAIIIIQKINL